MGEYYLHSVGASSYLAIILVLKMRNQDAIMSSIVMSSSNSTSIPSITCHEGIKTFQTKDRMIRIPLVDRCIERIFSTPSAPVVFQLTKQ